MNKIHLYPLCNGRLIVWVIYIWQIGLLPIRYPIDKCADLPRMCCHHCLVGDNAHDVVMTLLLYA